MERQRNVQVPTDPPQECPMCGETMVLRGGEFLPMGREDWVRQMDPRPLCPTGHRSGDEG